MTNVHYTPTSFAYGDREYVVAPHAECTGETCLSCGDHIHADVLYTEPAQSVARPKRQRLIPSIFTQYMTVRAYAVRNGETLRPSHQISAVPGDFQAKLADYALSVLAHAARALQT